MIGPFNCKRDTVGYVKMVKRAAKLQEINNSASFMSSYLEVNAVLLYFIVSKDVQLDTGKNYRSLKENIQREGCSTQEVTRGEVNWGTGGCK